jgi:hypothetical protein
MLPIPRTQVQCQRQQQSPFLDVTGGPRLLTFPSAKRAGYSGAAITTLNLETGEHWVSFYYDGTTLKVRDTKTELVDLSSDVTGTLPASAVGSLPVVYGIAASDETTAVTVGTGKVTFRMPHAMTLTDVRVTVTTAATGGTLLTVDVNESGASVLGTKVTLDASEKTSTTAATPRTITDASLANDAEMTIDFDAVGSTIAGAGVKVWLIGTR